jgi:hypothetical protein
MKWRVKIWLAPSVQEEPEEFTIDRLSQLEGKICWELALSAEKALSAVRKIEIIKSNE